MSQIHYLPLTPGFFAILVFSSGPIRPKGWRTLIDEYVRPFPPFSLLLPSEELETVDLIPLQVMNTISAALKPADDDGALPQVDVIPSADRRPLRPEDHGDR